MHEPAVFLFLNPPDCRTKRNLIPNMLRGREFITSRGCFKITLACDLSSGLKCRIFFNVLRACEHFSALNFGAWIRFFDRFGEEKSLETVIYEWINIYHPIFLPQKLALYLPVGKTIEKNHTNCPYIEAGTIHFRTVFVNI